MAAADPVRWGILGTARIADTVGKAIQAARGATLATVGSRTKAKAAEWASARNVPGHAGSYQEVLDDPDVDAVYIPLPPSMHAEWTIRAAEHGKHVLCEKPLADSLSAAEEMAQACRQHNVQLMDGVMWVHHPRAAEMKNALNHEHLGALLRVTSCFGIKWQFPPDDLRMQRALGGGSLLDLGWYNVRAALWAFDSLPRRVWGSGHYENDVDTRFSGLLWFDEPRVASFDCGFGMAMRRWLEVTGVEGALVCNDFTKPWDPEQPRFWLQRDLGEFDQRCSPAKIQEVCMIERFCEIVRSGTIEARWPDQAVATQRVCEMLDRSARSNKILDL